MTTSLRPALIAVAAAAALTGAAHAAPAVQPSARLCTAETSTPGTQACLHKALDAADAALNAAYRTAMTVIGQDDRGMSPEAKAQWKAHLVASQRAWIAFRDADCGDLTFDEWNNGSGTTGALYACRYDKTVQRTDDLLSRYPLK